MATTENVEVRIQLTIPFMVQTKCRDHPITQPEREHNLYDFKQLIVKKKRIEKKASDISCYLIHW